MQIQPIPALFEVICIFINPIKLIADISIVKVTIILAINSIHHNLFYIWKKQFTFIVVFFIVIVDSKKNIHPVLPPCVQLGLLVL